jgi:hypothetical protein
MKKAIFLLLVLLSAATGESQIYMTRNGFIGFYSKTPLEDIRGENNQVYAVIDAGKKNLAFSLLVKGFLFRKELMQTHFNENYAESDKYPKSTFSGTYTGDVDPAKNGTYNVQVKGQLTFHGVTRTIEVPATIEVKDGKLSGKSGFRLDPADYNIKIPSVVRDKIARVIDVRVSVECNEKK